MTGVQTCGLSIDEKPFPAYQAPPVDNEQQGCDGRAEQEGEWNSQHQARERAGPTPADAPEREKNNKKRKKNGPGHPPPKKSRPRPRPTENAPCRIASACEQRP